MSATPTICVVGAGLSGTMMAAMLSKLGFCVDVYEKRESETVEHGSHGGDVAASALKRSINLALSQRGIEALRSVGLLDVVMKSAIPMPCRVIHQIGVSQAIKQPYGKPNEAIHSVSRQLLNSLLLEKAQQDPNTGSRVRLHFGYSLLSCDKEGNCVFRPPGTEKGKTSSDLLRVRYDLVIGADGAYSAVRESMLRVPTGRVSFSRAYIAHGYKELSIPPKKVDATGGLTWALDDHQGLHIWPRGSFMLIALPNPDFSFTATLFAPISGPGGFDSIEPTDAAAVTEYFQMHFPDVLPLMPDIAADYASNPVGSLVTVRVNPWKVGAMLLLGDAAHAVVPFYGQGMNAAFEDCLILYEAVQRWLLADSDSDAAGLESPVKLKPGGGARADATESESDPNPMRRLLHAAAAEFASTRRPAADALADLCIDHYNDMASNTASTLYLLQQRAHAALHWLFPKSFVPLYTMVAFTRTPYHEAVVRAARQDSIARACVVAVLGVGVTGVGLAGWIRWRQRR